MRAFDNHSLSLLSRSPAWLRRLCAPLGLAACAACGAPTAGTWQGKLDLGPVDSHDFVVSLPAEGLAGEVQVVLPQGPATFRVCAARARNYQIEMQIDWQHPDCKVPAGAPAAPRLLRGTYGPGVLVGKVLEPVGQGEFKEIGMFRAYR